jgi:hypothetical protein
MLTLISFFCIDAALAGVDKCMPLPLSSYHKGRRIRVSDKMQGKDTPYSYVLTYDAGTNLRNSGDGTKYDFNPRYTPRQMLRMGVFEGKYLNDCTGEFPASWYKGTKLSPVADPSLNYFGVKSRLSLQEWRRRGWIPVHPDDKDIRGWFQWYCRYWLGRRVPSVDAIQIKRWRAFVRHYAQVKKSSQPRLRQRQALLQWSWPCDAKFYAAPHASHATR